MTDEQRAELTPPSMSPEMQAAATVLMTHGRSQDVEDYVQALTRRSGQACDWGFIAGRAIVHTTGDVERVRKAAVSLRWMEVAMQDASSLAVGASFAPEWLASRKPEPHWL